MDAERAHDRTDRTLPPFLGSVRAVAYANWTNVALHRAVMRVLHDNRERGGRLRLTPTEILVGVERLGVHTTPEQLAGSLNELAGIEVIEAVRNFERVRSAAELRHNHFSYDITQAGEAVEQFLDQLAALTEAVGSLDAARLARIHALLGQLATAVAEREL